MMRPLHILIIGAGVFIALRALREARPRGVVTIGQARILKRPRVEIDIGNARVHQTPAPRGGGNGATAPAPMDVRFSLRVSGLEKLGVSAADVRNTVLANADVLPGVGTPTVVVSDVSSGYAVAARYPDSTRAISSSAAKTAIEGIDPRLRGRVSNVKVSRAQA